MAARVGDGCSRIEDVSWPRRQALAASVRAATRGGRPLTPLGYCGVVPGQQKRQNTAETCNVDFEMFDEDVEDVIRIYLSVCLFQVPILIPAY